MKGIRKEGKKEVQNTGRKKKHQGSGLVFTRRERVNEGGDYSKTIKIMNHYNKILLLDSILQDIIFSNAVGLHGTKILHNEKTISFDR